MSKETLLHRPINARDFQPVEEKPLGAEGLFKELKKKLYNPELKAWANSAFSIDGYNELLGTLVEGMFDKHNARKKYEALKQTPLYNSELKRWRNSYQEDLSFEEHFTIDQLLGILTEDMLAQGEEPDLIEKPTPLPEVRRF